MAVSRPKRRPTVSRSPQRLTLRPKQVLPVAAKPNSTNLAPVFAEPISVAGAKKLRKAGVTGRGDTVVCNLTGHGLKQPEAIRISQAELTPIAPTLEAVREHIKRAEK